MLLISGLFACTQMSPATQKTLELAQNSIQQGSYENNEFKIWQVGQWSLYKTSSIKRDGVFNLFNSSLNKGFIRILVAAASKGSFWLELEFVEKDKEQRIAALITEDFSAGYVKYKINELKINEGKEVKHLTGAELIEGKGEEQQEIIQSWLNLILHSVHDGYHRNVKLPAGEFLNVREVPITLSLKLGQMNGYVWYHNAVPIFPVAKFELTRRTAKWFDTVETAELVDFGSVGQKSYFSYE